MQCPDVDLFLSARCFRIPYTEPAIVTKLINQIMYDGKRGVAQNVCYEAFEMIAQKTGKEAIEVFNAGHEQHHAFSGM